MNAKTKKPTGKVAQTITAVKNIAKRLTAGKTVAKKETKSVKKATPKTKAINAKPTSKPAKPNPASKPVAEKSSKPATKKPIRTIPAIPGKVAPGKEEPKEIFAVTTEDGKVIDVTYTPGFMQHLEFRGEISPTGYHSHFGYKGELADVREAARKKANELREAFMKDQIRQTRKAMKEGDAAVGKAVPSAKAPVQVGEAATGRGGKPRGKMSLLDAAVEILKEAKQPLCCKDITRLIFEQKLAESGGLTPHATLSAAMGREISAKGKDSRFKRADRGLFAINS